MKSRKEFSQLIVAILVFILLCTSACTQKESNIVKIGAVVPLTGPGAALGNLIKRGLDLGVEDVNSLSNEIQIEIVYEDSQTNPNQGLTAFRKLVSIDRVPVVLVAFSTVCNAVAPVAEELKVLMIGMTTSMPGLPQEKKYVMRLFPNADMLAGSMAEYASERFQLASVLYAEDEYGRTQFTTFAKMFEGDGRKIVFHEAFNTTETQFRTTVAKMLNQNPDVIFLPGYGPGYIALLNQIRENNKSISILGDSPLTNPPVYRAAGQAAEGIVVPATLLDAGVSITEDQKNFLQAYQSRFNENPSINVSINFDFIHMIARAANDTNFSPDAILDYFINTLSPYDGIVGEIRFDKEGESLVHVQPMKISKGTIINIRE